MYPPLSFPVDDLSHFYSYFQQGFRDMVPYLKDRCLLHAPKILGCWFCSSVVRSRSWFSQRRAKWLLRRLARLTYVVAEDLARKPHNKNRSKVFEIHDSKVGWKGLTNFDGNWQLSPARHTPYLVAAVVGDEDSKVLVLKALSKAHYVLMIL